MSHRKPTASSLLLPREHGAWVMLCGGWLLGLAAAGWPRVDLALAAGALALCAFIAQENRRRGQGGLTPPMAALGLVATLALADLAASRPSGLLAVTLAAGAALGLLGERWSRLGRGSLSVQLLGVAAFALALPLGAAAGKEPSAPLVAWLFGTTVLFYAGAVTNVRMVMTAPRRRNAGESWLAQPTVRANLAAALLLGVCAAALGVSLPGGAYLAVGLAVELARVASGARWLTRPPALKRVGLWETVWTAWYLVWAALAAGAWAAGK